MQTNKPRWLAACWALCAALTASCSSGPSPDAPAPSASSGQVTPPSVANVGAVSAFAAARLAEQATFGASPAVVAAIRAKGISAWIDEQLAMPATPVDLSFISQFPDLVSDEDNRRYGLLFADLAVGAPDQLRMRVAWALSQIVVVSDRKTDMYGVAYWQDFVVRNALGNYSDFLYNATIHPAMGSYLDNSQNRPKSSACPHCAPNENYARELMQLFTVGVVKLNTDGSSQRDSRGQPLETYTQRDVEELARVLTGWQFDPNPSSRASRNWGNWAKPMVPSTWQAERDSGAKVVMGRSFTAAQTAEKDLRDAVDFLVSHPNTGPFMALRMIQHLVKSNPTPAYVDRVARVFRANAQGKAGDMKAVVRAVLLDPEARAGDTPGAGRSDDGKIREPFLTYTALWRGLECRRWPSRANNWQLPNLQRPFSAESVFSYYAPTDRAPGSNLLAPEQRLINAAELTQRLGFVRSLLWNPELQTNSVKDYTDAGCAVEAMAAAYGQSSAQYVDFIGQRFFRGNLPPTLRNSIEQQILQPRWNTTQPHEGPMNMLGFALTSPSFGVIR